MDIRNDAVRRFDVSYQSYNRILSAEDIKNFKNVLDFTLQKELDFRNSSNKYKDFLNQHISSYDPTWLTSAISGIDQNIAISTSRQDIEITDYQEIEKRYLEQENIIREITGGGLLLVGLGVLVFASMKYGKLVKKKVEL